MAAIDKIYVNNYTQYLEFKDWCEQQPSLEDKYGKKVSITTYLFKYSEPFENCHPIFSAPYYVDAYVIRNCPLDYIQEEMMLNYGHWSQERIKSYYEDVKNWNTENGDCPYWAKLEDFIFNEDGTITLKGPEKSDYTKIKDGELYTSPKTDYEFGKHFKCIKHPKYMFNTPFGCKYYSVSVDLSNRYMWYNGNTWDFPEEFVDSNGVSSHAWIRSIKALKRKILKWKLPIGAILCVTAKYQFDEYKFIIKK